MKTSATCGKAAAFLFAVMAVSCGATAPEPGPADPANADPADADPAGAGQEQRSGYTSADVRFMQGMITHHAQALAMAALVPERTEREDIRRLAHRVELSQESEMALMSRWLERRGEAVAADGHEHGGHAAANGRMPGMASATEMERLADSRGAEFDRLFLELMIRHHEGALVMVEDLLATEGAGQEPELFQFAAHVDADQRAEIARMRTLLNALLP